MEQQPRAGLRLGRYDLGVELRELLARYEADGDEATYVEAKRGYEAALSKDATDARLAFEYGYLRECHARGELRLAASQYERAIELAPEWEKPRYQLMFARAARFDTDEAVTLYERRRASSPKDIREHRFLAFAYLLAGRPEKAEEVVRAGLTLDSDDVTLTYQLGEAFARSGRSEEAVEMWRRALELDPERIDARFAAAFLLEREGRLAEAADQWRAIIEWHAKRGFSVEAEWPKRELARVMEKIPAAG